MMLQAQQVLQNRYQLQQQLGHNSSRQTWLAQDLEAQPRQLVVVKLLAFSPQMQWEELKLFEREAQVLKHLNHPQIPRYRDHFSVDQQIGDGLPWFGLVQDYIPGESLQQLLDQGQHFSEVQVRQMATELLQILIYLHELSPLVLHRDIKPSNLIWGKDNKIYVVDFGAVQDRAKAEGVTFTVVGTSGYAPPEQLWGRAVPASDLYALGATLIHLLTRTPPSELVQDNLRIRFANRVSLNPSFTDWLEELTEPALEKRLSTARQALQILPTGRSPTSPIEKIRHIPGGSNWFAGAVFLGLFVASLVAITLPSLRTMVTRARQEEANYNLGSMVRPQTNNYINENEFTDSITELYGSEASPPTQTENYNYSIRTTPLSAFHYAIPRKKGLKGYVWSIFSVPGNDETEGLSPIKIMCETNSPTMTRPAEPIVRGNVIECGLNTKTLYDSKPVVVGKDFALGIKSLDYATAGQFDQAHLVAATIDFTVLKQRVLEAIATHSLAANQRSQQPGSLSQAVEIAKTIKETEIKAQVLAMIAHKYAIARQPSQATGCFSQALQIAQSIQDADIKATVLTDIARELAAAGQQSQVERILAQALEVAQTVKNPAIKDRTLTDIALVQAKTLTNIALKQAAVGKAQQADRTFSQALKVTKTIQDNDSRDEALKKFASEIAKKGQYEQALEFVRSIQHDSNKQRALEAILRRRVSSDGSAQPSPLK